MNALQSQIDELKNRLEALETNLPQKTGALGGKAKTAAKSKASRENGKLGGRPKLPSTPPPAS